MNAVSEVYNFARFVADIAFHTCAALGCGGVATPTFWLLLRQK